MICLLTNKSGRALRLLLWEDDSTFVPRWKACECPPGLHPKLAKSREPYLSCSTWDGLLSELAACTWDGKFSIEGVSFSLPVLNKKRNPVYRCGEGARHEEQMGHSRGAWWGSP